MVAVGDRLDPGAFLRGDEAERMDVEDAVFGIAEHPRELGVGREHPMIVVNDDALFRGVGKKTIFFSLVGGLRDVPCPLPVVSSRHYGQVRSLPRYASPEGFRKRGQ